jgi:hypothetical protein
MFQPPKLPTKKIRAEAKPIHKGVESHNLLNEKPHIFSKIWGFVLWEIFPAGISTLSRRYSKYFHQTINTFV